MKSFLNIAALTMATALLASVSFAGGEGCTEAMKSADGGKSCCTKMASGEAASCEKSCEKTAKGGGSEEGGKAALTGVGLGKTAPKMAFKNVATGSEEPLYDGSANATVVIFWNQECPYIVDVHDRAAEFAKAYESKGVRVVAIDAGVNNKEESVKAAAEKLPFPILVDNTSMSAVAFGAKHTPETYIFDKNGVMQYHGAFDGGAKATEKKYAADAVDAILAGKTPETQTVKAFGCSIKLSDAAKKAVKAEEGGKKVLRDSQRKAAEAAKTEEKKTEG